MNQEINNKFNKIMPETDDRVLCVEIIKPISDEGYELNFLAKLDKMLALHGEIRIVIYYSDYKGWEPEAALNDMNATLKYGKNVKKLALVNPPEREIFQRKIKQSLVKGEIQYFNKENLQGAIKWAKS